MIQNYVVQNKWINLRTTLFRNIFICFHTIHILIWVFIHIYIPMFLYMSVYFSHSVSKEVKQKCQGREGFCWLFKSSLMLFLPSVLLFIPFFSVCKYASSSCDICLKPSWFQINVYFVFWMFTWGGFRTRPWRQKKE